MKYFQTSLTLSDGRQLLYFDRDPGRVPQPDTRGLLASTHRGEIRYDALVGEWVTVAGHRQDRTFLPQADSCPLCPSSDSNHTEIPDSSYEVVIFDNRFPSLTPPNTSFTAPSTDFLMTSDNAGHCEVVCFTDNHDATFADLPRSRVELVIQAWKDRTAKLSTKDYVDYVFVFENFGTDIGVTISHPHGQIYAYPFIPSRAKRHLDQVADYRARTGRHLIDDLVGRETSEGTRIVDRGEHWVAFVPFAARWPFQVQLHPLAPVRDFTELDDSQASELADIYPRLLRRFRGLFDEQVPYIAAWNQAPRGDSREHGRLFLDLFTTRRDTNKLKYLAGSESAMGAFVNDVSPEKAADMLRGSLSVVPDTFTP